jgi:hypothetical protein
VEVVHPVDLLRALHCPHPSFLILHPALFVHAASAWDDDGSSFALPSQDAWRGSAGLALIHLPGVPSSETYLRFQTAWPIGNHSGVPRFSLAVGRWYDLASTR